MSPADTNELRTGSLVAARRNGSGFQTFRMEVTAAKMRTALWLGISFSVLSQCWMTFVRNHAKAMVACDFAVAVRFRFQILYLFVVPGSSPGLPANIFN
jgi:hypothetical protein